AGHLEQRVQIGPFRRDPLLVAKQADLRVESLMDDLPRDQLGQQRLPFLTLGVGADLAPESLVAEKESLRQVEQRLPQLVLYPSRAIAMLEILRGEILAQGVGMEIDLEHCLEARRCPLRLALGKPAKRGEHSRVHGERVVSRKSHEPPLDALGVGQGVLEYFAESKHLGVARAGTLLAKNRSSPAIRPGTNGQLRRKSLFRKRDDGPKLRSGQHEPPNGPCG